MYLVRSLRTFIGTNAERTAAGLESFLPGDEFIETDTTLIYIHNGMAWLLNSSAGSPGGSDTQIQFNDGGSFGGASSLAWNDSTNTLTQTKNTSTTLEYFLVLDQDGSGGSYIRMLAGAASGRIGMTSAYFDISSSSPVNITGSTVELSSSSAVTIDAGGYAATLFEGSGSDPAAIFNNPNWNNYHFQIKTENNDYMVYVDAGADSFNIGTDAAGTIAQFTSTAIVLNNAEADVDIRWGGNGVTNGVYFDAGNIRFGVNTVPSVALHVVEDSGTVAIFEESAAGEVGINSFYNPNTTDNNGSLIRFDTDTTGAGATARSQIAQIGTVFTVHDHATRTGNIVFRNYQNGSFGTRLTISGNVLMEGTTGALILSRLTTTQQNALTGVNGMIIYNTSTNKVRAYAGGAWVDLH